MEIKQARFLKDILTEKEFTELKKEPEAFQEAMAMYDERFIDSVVVMPYNTKRFLVKKNDLQKMPPNYETTLGKISLQQELINPVYVEVGENGTLYID